MIPPSVPDLAIVSILLVVVMLLSVITGKLSIPAALAGGMVGGFVFAGAGYNGLVMLGAFFILGTVSTSWKKELKREVGGNEAHPQRRTTGQVLANGGMAAVLGVLALIDAAHADLYRLLLAVSLASATADTLSSELGMVYGKRFYNILSRKKEAKGLDGVVSLEGTLIGVAGALVIGLIYAAGHGIGKGLLVIVVAGTIGNLTDSFLGATLERKQYINNDWVNFMNTVFAVLFAWVCY
jgi:uncharacterized protein (TIGR00297 family)